MRKLLTEYGSVIRLVANHPRMLVSSFFGTWVVFGLLFMFTESFGDDPKSLLDALYWSSTTMTTVGFGDVLPTTVASKILTIFFEFWSVVFIIAVTITAVVDHCRIDKHKNTHDEQEWEFAAIEKIAAALNVELPPQPEDY